jgi:hypothetical protein
MTAPNPGAHRKPAADEGGLAGVLPPGYIQSLIRTWVPVAVGSVLAWAAVHWHIVVDPGAGVTVATIATAFCIAGYYALCRLVEKRWPRLGALLLSVGLVQDKPVYAGPDDSVRLINTNTGEVRRVDPPGPNS